MIVPAYEHSLHILNSKLEKYYIRSLCVTKTAATETIYLFLFSLE